MSQRTYFHSHFTRHAKGTCVDFAASRSEVSIKSMTDKKKS